MTKSNQNISAVDPDQLIRLLQRQSGLYIRLRELCDTQTDLLNSDPSNSWQPVLQSRQEAIDELQQIEAKLDLLQSQTQFDLSGCLPEQQQLIQSLANRIVSLRNEISEISSRHYEQLLAARNQIAGELEHSTRASQALASYKADPNRASVFTDRQG